MKISSRNKTLAACALASLTIGALAAPAPRDDGWHRWQVDAVDGAPAWCCYDWRGERARRTGCNLDDGQHGFTTGDNESSPQRYDIYVQIEDGDVRDIRALAPSCPVESAAGITDHGSQDATGSVNWLRRQLTPGSRLGAEALAAIAVHAGARADRVLEDTARRGASSDLRQDAVFWMGQARAQGSAATLRDIMFNDQQPKMREHAAFSISQTELPGRVRDLTRLAETDASHKVRGQAWFWLAQTGDSRSEEAIFGGLRKEENRKTRDGAIFALSQLPGDRSVDALVRVVETRSFDARDRKQALFWLAQSESDRAVEYLARVLR